MESIQTYEHTIFALGAMAVLMLLQVIVSDIIGVVTKHTPGATLKTDHNNLLFRTSRTVANTGDSVSIFLLATLFCIFSHASPTYTSYAAWGFVSIRTLYALFYYFNFQILRSVMFGLSLLTLAALLIVGVIA